MATVKSNISSLDILQKNFTFLAYTLQNYINENITKENFYNTYMKKLTDNIDELKKNINHLEEELKKKRKDYEREKGTTKIVYETLSTSNEE